MAALVLEKVSKRFPGGTVAVDGLDLRVEDGELLVLLGPSGCGKTTTLRMIAGLETPSEGRITIGDRVVNHVAPKDRDVAMVFQGYALYPHLTVYGNMAFGAELRSGSSWLRRAAARLVAPRRAADLRAGNEMIDRQVRETAAALGIDHLLNRRPEALSGGERQRVALGRAIVRQPAVFLFDEPLSNLDARLRLEMRRELKQLHQRLGATMLYVTHDQTEALTLGQRVAVMNRGKIHQADTPLTVYSQPADRFVAGFVGTPPMNFVEGRIEGSPDEPCFRGADWSVPVDKMVAQRVQRRSGRRLALGIRPEHIVLGGPESSARGGFALAGTVELIEPTGATEIVHLKVCSSDGERTGCEVLRAVRRSVGGHMETGRRVWLKLDMTQAHWFDGETGANLAAS